MNNYLLNGIHHINMYGLFSLTILVSHWGPWEPGGFLVHKVEYLLSTNQVKSLEDSWRITDESLNNVGFAIRERQQQHLGRWMSQWERKQTSKKKKFPFPPPFKNNSKTLWADMAWYHPHLHWDFLFQKIWLRNSLKGCPDLPLRCP